MTHQLGFQFEAVTLVDFDRLIALSDTIAAALPPTAKVDGHDYGTDGMNIFIHTSSPKDLFEPVCEIICHVNPALAFKAGFRSFDEDHYTVLWPPDAVSFSVA